MRRLFSLPILASTGLVALIAAGCLQPSLSPLFEPKDSRFDDRLSGAWTCNADETWTFTRVDKTIAGKAFAYFSIDVKDGDLSATIDAITGRLGAFDFVSFSAQDAPHGLPAFARRQYLAIATFGRYLVQDGRVHLLMLPAQWFVDHKDDKARKLGVVRGEDDFVLTAPPRDLQKFALAHAEDKEAFKEAAVLVRPGQPGGSCYSER